MKKIIFLLTVLTTFSCTYEIDTFNENPNNSTTATPSLLLTQTEIATFAIHSGDLARIPALLTQQVAGVDGQYLAYAAYTFSESDMDNSWLTLYNNTCNTASTNIKNFGAANPYYSGISKILLVVNMTKTTDLWNDVPLSDAFNALEGVIQPTYDTQEEVYQQMQVLLTDAIAELAQPESANILFPGDDDLIYGGDVAAWTKAAYTIKARLALRLTNVDGPTVAANNALGFLAAGGMTSNDDDMNAVFSTAFATNWNQWYAFDQQRGYVRMGKYFIDYLIATGDPRLPFYATEDSEGNYRGVATNEADLDASNVGPAINGPAQPLGMVTFAEAKFIEAEAKFLIGDATAQQAFEDGVSASLRNYVGSVDQTFVTSVTSVLSQENIIQQKYVALFSNSEVYNDWRRTGFPVLVPNPDVAPNVIPQRMPTPSYENLYNPNAIVVSDLAAKVWWAK